MTTLDAVQHAQITQNERPVDRAKAKFRADPQTGRRRPLSPALTAAGHAALAANRQRSFAELVALLHPVPGRDG